MDRGSALVALGILASRLTGFLRQRVFSHYFGLQSDAADAFMAAFRIPNVLQNLFGEGALSASFIPVYASRLARGERDGATALAGSIAALLALVTSLLVAAGVAAAPLIVTVVAPGFAGAKRDLTIAIVRILFPGAGLLVASAWCLGILNSHRRFLLSYIAPVVWNAAMIAVLLWWGSRVSLPELARVLAWGAVAGSALQVLVQLPSVLALVTGIVFRPSLTEDVRMAARNFVPVFFSRGVVQISAYVDEMIASLLPTGAVTGLANAQLLYTLPVSLFGLSVAAASLPAMSGAVGTDAIHLLRDRVNSGLRHIAFFVVPSAVAFLTLGDVIAAAIFQTGRFTAEDATYVWAILAGSSLGLLATTLARLYSSTFYALRDTRTPLRFALVHVAIATTCGYAAAMYVPPLLGIGRIWGTVGLTAAASLAGWIELLLLRGRLNGRIGSTGLPAAWSIRLWTASLAAAALSWGVRLALPGMHPVPTAIVILGMFGLTFVMLCVLLKIEEAGAALGRLRGRRLGGQR